MNEIIEIEAFAEKGEMSLSATSLFHRNCASGRMSGHRNPITDIYTFKCECGFEVSLAQNGKAATLIAKTAIDEQERDLPPGTYETNPSGAVSLAPRRAQ